MIDRLPPDARRRLLQYARETLAAAASGRAVGDPPHGDPFDRPAAVFVTLRLRGELRGCVGRTVAELRLGDAVGVVTRDAACEDPRFGPVRPKEVEEIHIEISRLTPFVASTSDQVEVGRHGVLVRCGRRAGLLLPQVAAEFECDAAAFLGLACRKAGMDDDAWLDPSVKIFTFEAEVFGE